MHVKGNKNVFNPVLSVLTPFVLDFCSFVSCLIRLVPPEELKRQTEALENSQSELSAAQTQLSQAQSEIETIKAVATVSENTKQEAIDQVRSQWQEEVASLQAIMKGKLGLC